MRAIRGRRTSRRTFSRLAILGLAAGMFTLAAALPATATSVLDQSFTTPDDLFSAIGEGCTYIAQTFTAGVTGTLTGVNIDVQANPDAPPLRVVIRRTHNGSPLGTPLGVRSLAYPKAPLSRLIAFDEGISVVAGRLYAIQVNFRGVEAGSGGQGGWDGAIDDHYLGGRAMGGDCPSYGDPGFWDVTASPYDLHFRTYVEPTP
jgi:hypothetical protein